MNIHADGNRIQERREDLVPVKIIDQSGVRSAEQLLTPRSPCISFSRENCTRLAGIGAYVLLDFGQEICGSARIVTRAVEHLSKVARWRITFGESVSEACSCIGYKNATNDHSPRDFEIITPAMSDLTFGQTGFRFLRLELLSDAIVLVKNIYAVSVEPEFPNEGSITTNDEQLNEIIRVATRTLKLCFQNGYIWDGIKRDRLVWCGDLHPEILASLYMFGNTQNIKNSLNFLRDETPPDKWINNMPPYSAWWVICLCDYCRITGDTEYYKENRKYALSIISHINRCFDDTSTYRFTDTGGTETFLDWSTYQTPDSPFGSAAVYAYAAKKMMEREDSAYCRKLLRKMTAYFTYPGRRKPTCALQILAGRQNPYDLSVLEENGAADFSTFMAYYILTAMSKLHGRKMLTILKSYYGAMLDRGATTFWEDFNIKWLEGSGRIDEMPTEDQYDIHGDYGRYCYKKFRHSLCHGWSAGILAFIVEYILGIQIEGKNIRIDAHYLGITDIDATIPLSDTESLTYHYSNYKLVAKAPDGYKLTIL